MERTTNSLICIVLLAGWFGASAIVAVVVAPAAFEVLPTRPLAGAFVGRVLPTLFWTGMLVGTTVAVLGRSMLHRGWSTAGGVLLTVSSVTAQLMIAPRIAAIRAGIGGAIEFLDPSDPRRIAFGRLHGLSVGSLGVGMIACLITLVLIARFASTPISS